MFTPRYASVGPAKALLASTTIKDVVGETRPVITVPPGTSVKDALKLMKEHNVIAVGVRSKETGVLIGFVSMLDIANLAANVNSMEKSPEKETPTNWIIDGNIFATTTVETLVNTTEPLNEISPKSSVEVALLVCAGGAHRLAVLNSEGSTINVLSQSDIANFLAQNVMKLGQIVEYRVEELQLGGGQVVTVSEATPVFEAVRKLRENSVSAVAVVDTYGKLVSNFSTTDLQGLTAENFNLLGKSVKEFLTIAHGGKLKDAVACYPSSTVESVLLKMGFHKIHRVYVVDRHMYVVGVISITDIMQMFSKMVVFGVNV